MPDEQEKSCPQELPPELKGFRVAPVSLEDGLPVFREIDARKELVRRFGLPNAVPGPGETPFGNTRCLFVDDHNGGKPIAWLICAAVTSEIWTESQMVLTV